MGEILINQLFAGAYLQEGTNIGHEVINLFRDDNDENYLYITPMGNVKGHNVDKVLFVQNIAGRETMEVVMKAEGLSNTSADDVQKIFYAGVNITDCYVLETGKIVKTGKAADLLNDDAIKKAYLGE